MWCFKDTAQMSELTTYEFNLPKFGESTTDPTYYEPQATRIANMKKSAGSMQGIFDFPADKFKDIKDPDKMSETLLKNISNSNVDPRFSKRGFTREEVSQITSDMSDQAQNIVESKKAKSKKVTEEVREAYLINKLSQTPTQNNNTESE